MQQDFTTLPLTTKKRYVVITRIEEEPTYFCEMQDCVNHREHTCIVCNRLCCNEDVNYAPQFGNPCRICDECWELPLEDQQRIAQLTKDLNQ